jgi:Ca-activated chloride channel family protein
VLRCDAESLWLGGDDSFLDPRAHPLSSVGVHGGAASYSDVRRHLRDGSLPPPSAVRVEELLDHFRYDYPAPRPGQPFALVAEAARCPWNPRHLLVHLGLRARSLRRDELAAPRNLVFVVDVSASMADGDKLPLIKAALRRLVPRLSARDSVAIVGFGNRGRLLLPATRGDRRAAIMAAIDRLEAGGSTTVSEPFARAYQVARAGRVPGGVDRVIVATDGELGDDITRHALARLFRRERLGGVLLSVLGVGRELKGRTLDDLAGDASYAYLDGPAEARNVLLAQVASTAAAVASNVKIQVELNPRHVDGYRLIGYQDRPIVAGGFDDEAPAGGELGAGQRVTLLYEIDPAADEPRSSGAGRLRYQAPAAASDELLAIKVRYRDPGGELERELSTVLVRPPRPHVPTSPDFRFAAAVAAFGMLLRAGSCGDASFALVSRLARGALGRDPDGRRAGFLRLVAAARRLSRE